jgi:hypothetical protein
MIVPKGEEVSQKYIIFLNEKHQSSTYAGHSKVNDAIAKGSAWVSLGWKRRRTFAEILCADLSKDP